MPTFTYHVKIRVDLQQFSSGEELRKAWRAEAEAAVQAVNQGAFQLWKDAAEPVIYAIVNIEADNAAQAGWNLYNAALSLPMGANRQFVVEEARLVVPYQEWADTLANA